MVRDYDRTALNRKDAPAMLHKAATYEELVADFRWRVPEHYNIGVDVCDRHATGKRRLALIFQEEGGAVRRFTFDDIKAQ